MTRINIGVPVRNLTDQHLLAEHCEIKRICAVYSKFITKTGKSNKIPTEFTLGTGHVLFFIDKGLYTYNRYKQIYDECLYRGFEVEYYGDNWQVYNSVHFKDYIPTIEDTRKIVERISERIMQSRQEPRYFSEYVEKTLAVDLIKLSIK